MNWATPFYAAIALVFLIVEGIALKTRYPGDTFSEHIWRWLGREKLATPGIRLRRFAFLAFTAWLVAHLFTGWV